MAAVRGTHRYANFEFSVNTNRLTAVFGPFASGNNLDISP